MELEGMRDTCPKERDNPVDYRRCKDCGFFHGQIAIGSIECKQPNAYLVKPLVRKDFGRYCDVYALICPFKLETWAGEVCIGGTEQCEAWRGWIAGKDF